MHDDCRVEEAYAPALLLVIPFLLLGCLAFAAEASVETILLAVGVLTLIFLAFCLKPESRQARIETSSESRGEPCGKIASETGRGPGFLASLARGSGHYSRKNLSTDNCIVGCYWGATSESAEGGLRHTRFAVAPALRLHKCSP